MVKTGWIYLLKREELVPCLQEFELDTTGTVEELRKRLVKFMSGEHSPEVINRLQALQEKFEVRDTLLVPGTSTANTPGSKNISEENQPKPRRSAGNMTTPSSMVTDSRSNLMDQVRKWGLSYNGNSEPLVFIERVEELAEIYEVSLNHLPRFMPEFLCERALVWYRNNNAHWEAWSGFKADFLAFFLPTRYFERLEDEIRARWQRPEEQFKDYVLEIQTLMRHSGLTAEQKLQRIFQNAQARYKWYIRRKDFGSLAELISLAEDMESISNGPMPDRETVASSTSRPGNGPMNRCHRCGENGHYANRCPRVEDQPSGNAIGSRRS